MVETDADETINTIHEAGITGENVSIGVLDVTSFDIEYPLLQNRIVAANEFGSGASAVDGGDSHGTSVAATIARTAPDAELYLATFETPDDYEAGLEWLITRDVDVVVAPVADAGTLGGGSSQLAQSTTKATERGVVVVAPAGNLGTGHWSGNYSPDGTGTHTFESGSLNKVTGAPGRAEFHLSWEDPDEEYLLELHRINDGGSISRVAQSLPREHGNTPSERLTARLDADNYALAVSGPKRETGTRLRIASATHSLTDNRPSGSIAAPADAPGVISVGAIDSTSDEVEPYSSRGPTTDGRLGVYVVASGSQPTRISPSFEGTSAAAAYVGGIAALVVDASPTLEPNEVRWTITSTAEPVDGIDVETGHGRVDPREAVLAADSSFESE
ncbi:S8 family serine peptidase [Natrialba asiatica]|uniref:S8 family serine peptidase n=1 Tax=Natrialba asiatica TaxID=64602 RepID=UPI001F4CAFE0|nr:S8 family serine peptidase [Natrialba asiatica]